MLFSEKNYRGILCLFGCACVYMLPTKVLKSCLLLLLILMLRKAPLPDCICVFMFGEQGENGSWYFKSGIFSLVGEIVFYIMFNNLTYLKR